MTTIIVADDHGLVRMGIARMLSDIEGFDVVAEAETGEKAVHLARELNPDIVLMDVKMPGIGGIEATRKIQTACRNTKVIAVTAVADELFIERFMQAGASGYVTKEAGFDEILNAVSTVMQGAPYMSADIARQIALKNLGPKHDASPFEQLSERELQTALLIASGYKVNQIADTFCVSPKTVNSYRYRIFDKLGINSDVDLTLLAVKYRLLEVEY